MIGDWHIGIEPLCECKAIDKIMVECRKCGIDSCKKPCKKAADILLKYGLEYKG